VISLGTSDTIFVNLSDVLPTDSQDANIFCSALDQNGFMALCCYKNGSLVREKVLAEHNLGNTKEIWERVSNILTSKISQDALEQKLFTVYFEYQEIGAVSKLGSNFKCTYKDGQKIDTDSLSFEEEIVALIAGQFIAKRAHIKK